MTEKKKRKYVKPHFEAYELPQLHILAGSNGDGGLFPMGDPEDI